MTTSVLRDGSSLIFIGGTLTQSAFMCSREKVRFALPNDQHPRLNHIPLSRVEQLYGGVSLRCDPQLSQVESVLPPGCDPRTDGPNFNITGLLNYLLEEERKEMARYEDLGMLAQRSRGALRRDGGGFVLTLEGPQRYFWLTRDEQILPGRLLNLIQCANGDYVITVEILMDSDEKHRCRLVDSLSVHDLPYLLRDPHHTAEKAQACFVDSLSPSEFATVGLAQCLGIRTNRYQPEFGLGRDRDVQTAGSVLGHLAGVSWLYELYPGYKATLEQLARRERVSVSDILSYLNPRSFAQHFMLPPNSTQIRLEYCWLITEDGALKLCPFNIEGGNLRKLVVRLAHGRNVFASGTLIVQGDGTVEVLLNSQDYQHSLGGRAPRTAGLSQVGDLHEFVAIVFELQAGLLASSVGGRSTNWRDGMSARRLREWSIDHQIIEDLYKTFGPILDLDGRGGASDFPGEQAPIPFVLYNEWLKNHPAGSQRSWAKAVLGVSDDSLRTDISASYRRIAKELHPDKPTGSQEKFVALREAYDVLMGAWSMSF